jgi:hypothetical protein
MYNFRFQIYFFSLEEYIFRLHFKYLKLAYFVKEKIEFKSQKKDDIRAALYATIIFSFLFELCIVLCD